MIVDFHTHILPPAFRGRRAAVAERDATFRALFPADGAKMATAPELIEAMDEDGVDVSVVLGYGWSDRDVAREANDYLLESASRYPGRIVPFCSLHPAWGDEAMRELERCADGGARGIGELHPTPQQLRLASDESLDPVMAFAKQHDMPVVVHGSEPVGHGYAGKGTTHPEELLAFAERYPEARIVAAHWGGGLPFYALMPEVRRSLANVLFDSAASPFLYDAAVFPTVARAAGADHVLFGSDYPLLRARRVAEQASANLTACEASAVLGGNAARLLGL